MIKYFKKNLSAKIFLITFLLLGIACSGTYLCIIKLLPPTYSNLINDNAVKASMLLVKQISACDNILECEDSLIKFSQKNDSAVWLEDENGNIIYPKETDVEIISGDIVIPSDESNTTDATPANEKSINYYPVILKNGDAYTLAVQTDLLVVKQTTQVLWLIFPYVIIMIFLLSFICSWLYARYITRPIVQLSLTSQQMAELDFSGKCEDNREDELGHLAKNLNSLSTTLSATLKELQATNIQLKTDMEREHELECQRIDFFSSASHELKTPLTILKGHLTGMINSVSGYENHMFYLERSLAVVDKMEILVKELLYISQTGSNNVLTYTTVDIAELLRVQIAGITDLLTQKDQHLHVNIPNKILCKCVQSQMERAIQNILVNAIRYSPNREKINIHLSNKHDMVHCTVENTGIHIADDALAHLFEAFYRIDVSRNRNTGGTGLGLYIVSKIMEIHHAEYGITNTNNGVMFWFSIPTVQ